MSNTAFLQKKKMRHTPHTQMDNSSMCPAFFHADNPYTGHLAITSVHNNKLNSNTSITHLRISYYL